MRIFIDPAVCTGHGLCYAVAPRLIHYDDRGYGVVRVPEVGPSEREEADRAVLSCPEHAISVVDE
jgi:ferredoxin